MWENIVFLVIYDTCDVVNNLSISLLPPIVLDNLFGSIYNFNHVCAGEFTASSSSSFYFQVRYSPFIKEHVRFAIILPRPCFPSCKIIIFNLGFLYRKWLADLSHRDKERNCQISTSLRIEKWPYSYRDWIKVKRVLLWIGLEFNNVYSPLTLSWTKVKKY